MDNDAVSRSAFLVAWAPKVQCDVRDLFEALKESIPIVQIDKLDRIAADFAIQTDPDISEVLSVLFSFFSRETLIKAIEVTNAKHDPANPRAYACESVVNASAFRLLQATIQGTQLTLQVEPGKTIDLDLRDVLHIGGSMTNLTTFTGGRLRAKRRVGGTHRFKQISRGSSGSHRTRGWQWTSGGFGGRETTPTKAALALAEAEQDREDRAAKARESPAQTARPPTLPPNQSMEPMIKNPDRDRIEMIDVVNLLRILHCSPEDRRRAVSILHRSDTAENRAAYYKQLLAYKNHNHGRVSTAPSTALPAAQDSLSHQKRSSSGAGPSTDEVAFVGMRTWEERDAELRKNAVALD